MLAGLETRDRGIPVDGDGDGACFGWQSPGSSRGAAGATRQGSPADEIFRLLPPYDISRSSGDVRFRGSKRSCGGNRRRINSDPATKYLRLDTVTIERPIDRSL